MHSLKLLAPRTLPQAKQGLKQGLARTSVLAIAGAVCVSCCLRSCCSLLFSAFTPLGQLWLRPAAGWDPGRSAAGRLVTCAAACECLQGTPGMVRPVMQGQHDVANAERHPFSTQQPLHTIVC